MAQARLLSRTLLRSSPRPLLSLQRPGCAALGQAFRPPRPAVSAVASSGARHASTVFAVKPQHWASAGSSGDGTSQTLFVIGLNDGKFFGEDSAEEGLKLLERINEQCERTSGQRTANYQLLFGLEERDLKLIEESHKVKQDRLTPSRELEREKYCEIIPLVQASMIDKCVRKALGRSRWDSQSHVAWLIGKHPREAIKLYWAFWRRNDYKNAAARKFWSENFPISSQAYFEEISELIAIRTFELLAAAHAQGKDKRYYVLILDNMFFDPVTRRLAEILGDDAAAKLESADVAKELRERATQICFQVPDVTPLLFFVYLGLPVLALQRFCLFLEDQWNRSGVYEQMFPEEQRD